MLGMEAVVPSENTNSVMVKYSFHCKNETSTISGTSSPEKRSRGRPRKDASVQKSIYIPSGRPRGRPRKDTNEYLERKAVNKYIYGDVEAIKADDDKCTNQARENEIPKPSSIVIVLRKRGRGRPRIHPAKTRIPGRGRGRPRKDSLHSQALGLPGSMKQRKEEDKIGFLSTKTSLTQRSVAAEGPWHQGREVQPSPCHSPIFHSTTFPSNIKRGILHPKKIKVLGRGRGRPRKIDSFEHSSGIQSPEPGEINYNFMKVPEIQNTGLDQPGSGCSTRSSIADIDSILLNSQSTNPLSPTVRPEVDGARILGKKRGRGRPRIHPVKVKVPGRSRGRPPKTIEQKAQKRRLEYIDSLCTRSPGDNSRPKPQVHVMSINGHSKQDSDTHTDNFPTLAIRMVGSLQPLYSGGDSSTKCTNSSDQLVESQSREGRINEELIQQNLDQLRTIQRLEDLVEVKNTAIEHLKGIVESLGVTVSKFVKDALNATAVDDSSPQDQPLDGTYEEREENGPFIVMD